MVMTMGSLPKPKHVYSSWMTSDNCDMKSGPNSHRRNAATAGRCGFPKQTSWAALCLTFFAPHLAHAEGVGLRDGTLDLVFAVLVVVWIAAPLLLFLLAFVSFRLSKKVQAHWSNRWSKINLLLAVCTLFAPAIGLVIHAGAKPTFFMGLI